MDCQSGVQNFEIISLDNETVGEKQSTFLKNSSDGSRTARDKHQKVFYKLDFFLLTY